MVAQSPKPVGHLSITSEQRKFYNRFVNESKNYEFAECLIFERMQTTFSFKCKLSYQKGNVIRPITWEQTEIYTTEWLVSKEERRKVERCVICQRGLSTFKVTDCFKGMYPCFLYRYLYPCCTHPCYAHVCSTQYILAFCTLITRSR